MVPRRTKLLLAKDLSIENPYSGLAKKNWPMTEKNIFKTVNPFLNREFGFYGNLVACFELEICTLVTALNDNGAT